MDTGSVLDELREDMSPEDRVEADRLRREVVQWHHDMYIALERKGRLKPENLEDVELAKAREANGEVDPLKPGAEDLVIMKLESPKSAEPD